MNSLVRFLLDLHHLAYYTVSLYLYLFVYCILYVVLYIGSTKFLPESPYSIHGSFDCLFTVHELLPEVIHAFN